MEITDIAAAAEIAHGAGARLAVDSTVATPVLTRPIELGADIVMHSATKYLNGHSDVIAGALATARRDEFWERHRRHSRAAAARILGAFEAWLLLRGMRTLYPRVERASRTAQAIAEHFAGHRASWLCSIPACPTIPVTPSRRDRCGAALAACSASASRAASGGDRDRRPRKVWKRATSLGGVESLIEHRASIEGPGSPAPPDLLRLSAGIEDAGDLIGDLEQALAGAAA